MKHFQGLRCVLLLACCTACLASARLGETEEQSKQRYGEPMKKVEDMLTYQPMIDGAVHHSYHRQGWTNQCAFVDGKAVRIRYMKMTKKDVNLWIQDDELLAILEGEAGGGQWQPKAKPRPTGFADVMTSIVVRASEWQNSNGATATSSQPRSSVMVESPAASAFIKARDEAKERQRKANIPKF